MLVRDEEYMHRGLWVDIVEGNKVLILENDVSRDFSRRYFTENTFHVPGLTFKLP